MVDMSDKPDDNLKIAPLSYYAHSGLLGDLATWQTLHEHLHAVGDMASMSAFWFNGQELAKSAGLLHDLGKYCPEFFDRLNGSTKRVDHATAGAKIAAE